MAPRSESELVFVLKKPLKNLKITLFNDLDAHKTKELRNVIDHEADFADFVGIVLDGRPFFAHGQH